MPDLVDRADWDGVALCSLQPNRPTNPESLYQGYQYATRGERLLAGLLDDLGIPYTPEVTFHFDDTPEPGCKKRPKSKIYVPDLILNRQAYIWTHSNGDELLLHGFEGKSKGSHRKNAKTSLLYEKRGIMVLIISTPEIERYCQLGYLPMRRHRY